MVVKRNTTLADRSARGIALLILTAVLAGNLLCDVGTVLAVQVGLGAHYFNIWFLVLGIIGIVGFGIALLRRRSMDNNATVDGVK